jgi:hypothetical protein
VVVLAVVAFYCPSLADHPCGCVDVCVCVCVPYDDVLGTTWLVVKKNSAKNIYTE